MKATVTENSVLRSTDESMKMRLKAVATTDVKEGATVKIGGVGKKWSGKYIVEKVDPPMSGLQSILLRRIEDEQEAGD